jgi:aspartyl-tRNA(Asn)/glutamyl-tRNA(Gln) amidotransferase subunit A
MTDLHWNTITEVGALLRDGSITSVELTQATYERIAETDPIVHAYIGLMTETALAAATAVRCRVCPSA